MTPTEQQILALLERRHAIDQTPDSSFTNNHRWLIEAVELLLRHQIALRVDMRKQRNHP